MQVVCIKIGSLMSIGYRLMYAAGLTPWDDETPPPELVGLVQGDEALPPPAPWIWVAAQAPMLSSSLGAAGR
jgi:hypothetical protein